jgi:hypothetical protein
MRTRAATISMTVVLCMAVFFQDRGHADSFELTSCPLILGTRTPVFSGLFAGSEAVCAGIDWRSARRDAAAGTILAFDLYRAAGAAAEGLSATSMTDDDFSSSISPRKVSGSGVSGSGVSGGRDVADVPILAAPERDALPMACIGLVGAAWACRRQMKQRRNGAEEGDVATAA